MSDAAPAMVLDPIARAAIEHACTQVLMRYAVAVDARDWRAVADLFTDDAVWTRPGRDRPFHGKAEVLAEFEGIDAARRLLNPDGPLQRHMFTTIAIEVLDPDTARGTAYAFVFKDDKHDNRLPVPMCEPELIVQYDELFRRVDFVWKIASHTARHIFSGRIGR